VEQPGTTKEDLMPQFMLLLYTEEAEADRSEQRHADMSEWIELSREMRESGTLLANGRLTSTDTATTVRVRDERTELVDGPFAVTKEVLAGYFLVECSDLDEALQHAARLPISRYGCVEVRAIAHTDPDVASPAQEPEQV